jgi:hypothetical protein
MSWHAHGVIPGLDLELAIRFDGTNWDDVTTDLRSATTTISRSRSLGTFPPGTASFNLDNRAGKYAPLNTSSPYNGEVLPGRHIRLRARYNSVIYDVWYGLVRNWGDSYPQAKDGIATVEAVQPSVLLSSYRGPANATPVGDDELSGARVSRVLTAAGWTLGTSVDAGIVRLQATDLTSDALSEITAAVSTEFGAFWCNGAGAAVFEHRHALSINSRSTTSQVTFGNGGGAEVPYLVDPGPVMSSGLDLVVNQFTAGTSGSALRYTEVDAGSVSALGATFADADTSLINSTVGTDYAQGNAVGMVYVYADPYQHPTSIVLRPAGAAAVSWPQALGRLIRDRVTVKVPTPWGTTYSCPVWVAGVSHAISPGDWVTTFEFDPANALTSTGFGVVGSAVVGTTKVAY